MKSFNPNKIDWCNREDWKKFLKSGDMYDFDHALPMNREELDDILLKGLGVNKYEKIAQWRESNGGPCNLLSHEVDQIVEYLKNQRPEVHEALEASDAD